MIIVSNTTPLHYIVLLSRDHILPAIFGEVIVPPAVVAELTRKDAPETVRSWMLAPPAWLSVQTPYLIESSKKKSP